MSTQVISTRPESGRSWREPPSPQRAPPPHRGLRERSCRKPGARSSAWGWGQHRGRSPVRCGRAVGCGALGLSARCGGRGHGPVVPVHDCRPLTGSSGGLCITGVQYFPRNLIKIPDCFSLKHEGVSRRCFSLGLTIFHLLCPG